MNAPTLLRLFFCLISLLGALPVAQAQRADQELAAPRVNLDEPADDDAELDSLTAEQRRDQTLRTLTNALRLLPHQTLVLRRVLSAELVPAGLVEPAPAGEVALPPRYELSLVLSAAQLQRLRAWEQQAPAGRLARLLALVE